MSDDIPEHLQKVVDAARSLERTRCRAIANRMSSDLEFIASSMLAKSSNALRHEYLLRAQVARDIATAI